MRMAGTPQIFEDDSERIGDRSLGVSTPKGKNCTLSDRRHRGRGSFRELTPWQLYFGSLDDVMASAACMVTPFPGPNCS